MKVTTGKESYKSGVTLYPPAFRVWVVIPLKRLLLFLPPAYVVRGKVLFSQVSVCPHLGGGGGYLPSGQRGLPTFPGLDRGVPNFPVGGGGPTFPGGGYLPWWGYLP